MFKNMITQENAKDIFNCDTSTGLLSWKISPGRKVKAGDIAGGLNGHGYRQVQVGKKLYMEHRLIWLWVYGSWPKQGLDHINGIKTDNRIENLREATIQINQQNLRKAQTNNKTGFLGVSKETGSKSYRATIMCENKIINIGSFATPEEAHDAYLKRKRELHKGCTI